MSAEDGTVPGVSSRVHVRRLLQLHPFSCCNELRDREEKHQAETICGTEHNSVKTYYSLSCCYTDLTKLQLWKLSYREAFMWLFYACVFGKLH